MKKTLLVGVALLGLQSSPGHAWEDPALKPRLTQGCMWSNGEMILCAEYAQRMRNLQAVPKELSNDCSWYYEVQRTSPIRNSVIPQGC